MLVLELKKKLEDLKKKVEEAEEVRNIRRGPNSWENLRTLKKLKLQKKEVFSQIENLNNNIIEKNIIIENLKTSYCN